jgi:hypothetical protein
MEEISRARQLPASSCCSIGIFITPAHSVVRPETGTYIRDMPWEGLGILFIYNNWTMDTVVVLIDKKVKPKLAVYLRSKDTQEVDGIEDGDYGL